MDHRHTSPQRAFHIENITFCGLRDRRSDTSAVLCLESIASVHICKEPVTISLKSPLLSSPPLWQCLRGKGSWFWVPLHLYIYHYTANDNYLPGARLGGSEFQTLSFLNQSAIPMPRVCVLATMWVILAPTPTHLVFETGLHPSYIFQASWQSFGVFSTSHLSIGMLRLQTLVLLCPALHGSGDLNPSTSLHDNAPQTEPSPHHGLFKVLKIRKCLGLGSKS